ncbi:MAG: ester cyclase [Candidatus Dormibacteraeota bacterium]|nr:ester cyclase [Candidatus Dormibacteraeota bacterium]
MSQIGDLVREHYEGFNTGDIDRATAGFSNDIVTVVPGSEMRGREAFKQYLVTFSNAMPDARLIVKATIESGSMLAIEGSFTGTHTGPLQSPQGEVPPTGRTIDLPYVDIFESGGEKLTGHRVYWDQVAFLTALGLMPEPSPS